MLYTLLWILTMLCGFYLAVLPEKPGNISCIFYYNDTLTCNWTTESEMHPETNYTLTRKVRHSSGEFQEGSCISKNGSCSLYGVPFIPCCVEVKAKNHLWEEESVCVPQKLWGILKPDPPQISKPERVPGTKQMLRVSWQRPEMMPESSLAKCQIHYRSITKNHSETATAIMYRKEKEKSYNISNLWDFANYTVSLRCALNESRFWSEWSSEEMGTTEEQAPLRVDLWRVIESHQPTGTRTVHLLWKENKQFPSSGIINGYRIKYFTESKTSFEDITNPNQKAVALNLSGEAYEISVVAHNSAGDSPEAILRIPSIPEESKDHQRIVTLNASALKEHMFVEWEPSDFEINCYVIEWYDELETEVEKRLWQNITNVTKWASPKGAFRPFRYYNISVYPLHKGEIKAPSSIGTYFHDGIPPGPSAKAENVDKNEAIIKWEEIPKAQRNGSIISYTVFYKAEDGEELGETVDVNVLQYRLKSLQPNTKYTARVMASTIAGGKNGTVTTFITNKFSVVDIILICVAVAVFILCILTVRMLWALKRHTLKRICWPKIPHPVITSCHDIPSETMLSNSSSDTDTLISILDVVVCSEGYNELQLPNPENFFKQTNDPAKDTVGNHDILCRGEDKAVKPFLQTDETLPALKVDFKDYENVEVQDQSNLNEKTHFNPYLKNSAHTREFLVCENSDQSTKVQRQSKTQPVPLASCLPKHIEKPYVALETFEFFSNINKLQGT